MRIGDVAKQLGVPTSKIRFWESNGVLQVQGRSANGYRDYDLGTIKKLEIVIRAQSLGFTLLEIRQVFNECLRDGCSDEIWKRRLFHKLEELERHLVETHELRERVIVAINDLAKTVRLAQISG